jgi:hypothetical protein
MSNNSLTIIEALVALNKTAQTPVSYNQVWRAIADGKLPASRDGKKWFIHENDLPLFAKALSKV